MKIGVFDIGGTSIKYGIIDKQGNLTEQGTIPTEAYNGGNSIIERVGRLAEMLKKNHEIEGIGISSAGQINSMMGKVVHATDSIPGYKGLNISDMLSEKVQLPVSVENDVNCTALGEKWNGNAKEEDDFLCVTIGTGIGGAIFLNGELYTGTTFAAGEWGHMTLYPNGKSCLCGFKGCYEEYASSRALQRKVDDNFTGLDLKIFFEKVREGHDIAVKIFDEWIEDLTLGLKSLIHAMNPSLILLGGGITTQGAFLEDAINVKIKGMLLPNHKDKLTIKLAKNRNQANLYGAAIHFWSTYESR